jgi:hypothetical protein
MSLDEFQKGLHNIRMAIQAALLDHKINGASLAQDTQGSTDAQEAVFAVISGGITRRQAFARDEVIDSGEAIDGPAATKVRALVAPFVR